MERVGIRKASNSDAAAMAAFALKLQAEELDTITRRVPPTEDEQREYLAKAEANGRAFFLLALDGEIVVGMLDIWAGEKDYNRHAARFGVSVLNGWRRRGIGRRLVETMIAETKSWPGFCRIELGCAPWNAAAIELYKSLGFTLEGTRRKAMVLGDEPRDELVMALVW